MPPDDFRRLCETSHVPLIRSITGDCFPLSHSCAYFGRDDTKDEGYPPAVLFGDAKLSECDVLTTMTFEARSHFEAFNRKLMERDNRAKIELDCAKFMDVSRTTMVEIGGVIESRR